MRPTVRRLAALLLALALLLPAAKSARASAFSDVPEEAWYAEAVRWASQRGILDESSDRFAPDRACTRGEAVSLLWRLEGCPKADRLAAYRDVDPADSLAGAIYWAVGEGLIAGYANGLFRPSAGISRAEVICLLWRYVGSPASEAELPFSDVPELLYYAEAVRWAVEQGVTAGIGADRFAPDRLCSRAELVCFLRRLDEAYSLQRVIVIDPGHQLHADREQEPVGPGAAETKARTASGTYGEASGLYEYELDLLISLQLREELERRGYRVILTRETHDVQLSNAERAKIANDANADAMIRIHANGSTDASLQGAKTINMTRNSPYNAWLYDDSRALSEAVLNAYCAATGAKQQAVWDTDTMTGINWSRVPVTILEMGYMTNAAEDLRMADPAYQTRMVRGIADGLDAYFKNH